MIILNRLKCEIQSIARYIDTHSKNGELSTYLSNKTYKYNELLIKLLNKYGYTTKVKELHGGGKELFITWPTN